MQKPMALPPENDSLLLTREVGHAPRVGERLTGLPIDLLIQSVSRLRVLALLYAFVFFTADTPMALLLHQAQTPATPPSARTEMPIPLPRQGPGSATSDRTGAIALPRKRQRGQRLDRRSSPGLVGQPPAGRVAFRRHAGQCRRAMGVGSTECHDRAQGAGVAPRYHGYSSFEVKDV